jgi:hypothetical protein
MGKKIDGLNIFVVLILLVGFNVGFIGGQESGDVEVPEEVVDVGEAAENVSVEFRYVDVDENVSEELNESEGVVENHTEEMEDEGVVDLVEENESVEENVSAEFRYVDIDELSEEEEVVDREVEREVVLKELVKDGKVELEFEILEGDDIEIQKKEVVRGDLEKDVLISSDEHFDDEVRVYSDLPSEAREEDILIVWENEDEVVEDVEYFDLDGDGLIERVSWIVPHLSSQHYSISIVVGGDEKITAV